MVVPPVTGEGGVSITPASSWSRFTRQQWGSIGLLLCCQSLMILDTSGLNVALASIGLDFGIPLDQTGGVNLGFVVALAAMIPLSGWMGERFGTIRVLMGCLALQMLGSLICATAPVLELLITGRAVQGIGSGGLVPLASSLLFRNFVPSERLRVMAALSLPISLAPALGPLVGGLVVDLLNWRWVFLVNVPIGICAVVVGLMFAGEAKERATRPLDLSGALLTVVGCGALVLGLERTATGSDIVLGLSCMLIGSVAIGILIPLERRKASAAFLALGLFSRRVFAKTTSITAAHSVGFMGFGLAGPLLLQSQLGMTAFQAGLVAAAGALGPIISGRFARRLITGIGPQRTIALSQTGILTGLGVIVSGYIADQMWVIVVGTFLCGASSLLTIMSCQTAGFAAVPATNLGDATALDGTARQVGNAVGIAIVSGSLAWAGSLGAAPAGVAAMTIGAIAGFHVLALVVLRLPPRLHMPSDEEPAAL